MDLRLGRMVARPVRRVARSDDAVGAHRAAGERTHRCTAGGQVMRIGIGLPAAVPGASPITLGEWAAESERLGFHSLAVLDRLVYDNLDPLVALAAAAARTERAELMTTVLGVPWRQSAIVVAKQLASLDLLSGGRLTAGLALGGWPEDYAATETPLEGRGARFVGM